MKLQTTIEEAIESCKKHAEQKGSAAWVNSSNKGLVEIYKKSEQIFLDTITRLEAIRDLANQDITIDFGGQSDSQQRSFYEQGAKRFQSKLKDLL